MEHSLSIKLKALSNRFIPKTGVIAWIIFSTGILYYCFAYLLRVYPSIMEPQLLRHFHITAASFGVLTSFYYFAYAPMQLPVGVSVDKMGPRYSLMLACATCLIGAALFARSNIFMMALIGRLLMGFGAAFAYVTTLKLAAIWLPQRFFATAVGVVTGSGMIAAMFTDIYFTHIVQATGYCSALYFPVIVGIGLFALITVFVRDQSKQTSKLEVTPEETHALSYRQLGKYLLMITKNPQMWIIGAVGAFLYLPSSVFLDVWAIPYMEHVYHLTPQNAAFGFSTMLAGWICSSFITGPISDVLRNRKGPLVIATFGAAITATCIIYLPHIPVIILFILLFIFGMFCGPHPLCFTLSKENYPQKISGSAIAFTNFMIMMGGVIFQPLVGKMLDSAWTGGFEKGLRIYTASNYKFAFIIIPLGLLIAGILSLYIKETNHKTMNHQS